MNKDIRDEFTDPFYIEPESDIINNFPDNYKQRISLINLNIENLKDGIEYSKLLATKNFYDYIPTETFLIFQTDTLINSKLSFCQARLKL